MQNKNTYIESEFASNCDDKLYPEFKLEEVTFEGDGRFKYRDIELKRGTKIGGGTYGDIFMLEPTNNGDKDKIPPLVIKQFKKVGSKEDPEIDFVRNNSAPGGAMEECNLIPSRILDVNPNPVNIMLGVRGDLSHFRRDKLKTDKGLDLSFNEFLELGKNVLDMLMCLESFDLRFTDLKDANILYSCFGPNPNNPGENGKIKVYMGDTGSIVKRKAHAYYTFNPYWLKTYFLSLPQFTNLTEVQKMVCYSIYGVNSESYIIYAFAILLLRLFLLDPSDIPLILYARALPNGSPPNSLPYPVTQEMINTEIEKLQGRFTDDENKIVKELLKSLIQEKWWISSASITEAYAAGVKTRSLKGIMEIIDGLLAANISTDDLSSSALALLQGISSDSVLATIKEDEVGEILSELSSLSQEDEQELKQKEEEIEAENEEYFAQEFGAIGDDLSVSALPINPGVKPVKSPQQKYNEFVDTHLGELKSESQRVDSMFETFNKEDNNYKLIIERLKNGLYNEVETVAKCLFGVTGCDQQISLLLQKKYGVDSSGDPENQEKEFVTNYKVRYNTLITVLFCLHFTQNSGINEGDLIQKVIVPFLSLVPSDYINESNFKELVGRYNTIEVDVDGKDAIKIAIDTLSKGANVPTTSVVSGSEDLDTTQDPGTQDLTPSSNGSYLSSLDEEQELPSIELTQDERDRQKLKVEELKKKEEERLQKIKDQIDADQEAAKKLQEEFDEEEAQMKKNEAPDIPPVSPDPNPVNKTWKPPDGSDNGKNKCWLNAPLYSILQNKVIREKILEAHGSGKFNGNKVLDTLYFLITDKEPWVEEKYNYVISRLKDADGDKIPPLFPANTAGGGEDREKFIREIMDGEYYDAAITINYLTEVLKEFDIYIYHIETLPFMVKPYVDCDKFDKEERVRTKNFWYNCTDRTSNTTLIAMVQSYNIYKKDKNGNVIQLDAGHFRAFIPTKKKTGDGTNDTPPMNKEDFNENYEWVKNDALYGFTDKTRSSEPVPGSHAYSFYIFLREPKTQSGGGKRRRVRTNKRRRGRVNRTGRKNRKSLRKSNRRSRKKENTLKKRVRKGDNKPRKRTLKKRR